MEDWKELGIAAWKAVKELGVYLMTHRAAAVMTVVGMFVGAWCGVLAYSHNWLG